MTDAPNKSHFEVFVAMNEAGKFEIGVDQEEAADRLASNCGGYSCRIIRLAGWMTPPAVFETVIDVPDDAGEIGQFEVAAKVAEGGR
jgi:hypothetical protein